MKFEMTTERLKIAYTLVTEASFILQTMYKTRECNDAFDERFDGLAEALWKIRGDIVYLKSILNAADGYDTDIEPKRLQALFNLYGLTPNEDSGSREEEMPF